MNTVIHRPSSIVAGLMLVMISLCAEAGLFDFGGTRWKEEALLHDGTKIIVTRTVERGGRHEIGQEPPIKEQRLSFLMPSTNQKIVWEDKFAVDVGSANFNLMLLDVMKGTPYLVVTPAGCLSYNKWGRPNPPYVIFKYSGKEWERISLPLLPAEIKAPNLLQASPDHEAEKARGSVVSAAFVKTHHDEYRQPEYRSIVREPLPSSRLCPPELTGFKARYPILPKSGVVGGK